VILINFALKIESSWPPCLEVILEHVLGPLSKVRRCSH
jgi:hypothetical protein